MKKKFSTLNCVSLRTVRKINGWYRMAESDIAGFFRAGNRKIPATLIGNTFFIYRQPNATL
jgi:hypothetical protein